MIIGLRDEEDPKLVNAFKQVQKKAELENKVFFLEIIENPELINDNL